MFIFLTWRVGWNEKAYNKYYLFSYISCCLPKKAFTGSNDLYPATHYEKNIYSDFWHCLKWSRILGTSPWRNRTSWEMKISIPLQILHAVRRSGGMHKNALFKGRSTVVAMVATAACSRPGASFSFKNLFLYLKLNTTLQIGTSTISSNIIRLYIDLFNFPWEWMWTHQ